MQAMTTPDERTRAVLHTRDFLEALLNSAMQPGVPDEVRAEARRLLRHYPDVSDLRLASTALPLKFGSPASDSEQGGL